MKNKKIISNNDDFDYKIIEKDRKKALIEHIYSNKPRILVCQVDKRVETASKKYLLDSKDSFSQSKDETNENSGIFCFGTSEKKISKEAYRKIAATTDQNISIQNAGEIPPEKIRELRELKYQKYDIKLDDLIGKYQQSIDNQTRNSARKSARNSTRRSSTRFIYSIDNSSTKLKSSIINQPPKSKLSI